MSETVCRLDAQVRETVGVRPEAAAGSGCPTAAGPAGTPAAAARPSRPGEIERTSMAIIDAELAERGIAVAADVAPVVRRVIHATADFDFAQTLEFTPGAVACGVAALAERGMPIVTDTNMALAGISRPSRERLGVQARCYMAHPTVAKAARAAGTTRAVAAMERAVTEHPQAVFAVGNAPTALFTLAEALEAGVRPSLVVGVPVGFVNVVEAKERILEACHACGVPAIVARGRKGGSTVATAICNALLYLATDTLDPAARGWG